jgi:L-Ala-D/L-Glu epimerase / N-acetyl-D-glutamate racemase
MNLRFYPYTIKLKDEFTISVGSRTTTPAIMVKIEQDGITGYGEASLPPYLKENQQSVINFLKKLNISKFQFTAGLDSILDYVDNLSANNRAAKAAVDIALHDLAGKIKNVPLYKYLNIPKSENVFTSYTIGISDEKSLKKKISSASGYKFLKIKLGTENDKKIIEQINSITDQKLFVDVNQGWNDVHFALDMISWLAEKNVVLVEQPLPKAMRKEAEWLKNNSTLPLIADEAIQTLNDIDLVKNSYSGINIKLMKCGGIRQAYRMILKARDLNIKIMIGCMTETSRAITAASHLAGLADWVDLDGAELIYNDIFTGCKIENGKLIIPESAGIGVKKIAN